MKNTRLRFGAIIALILCLAMLITACGEAVTATPGDQTGDIPGTEQPGGETGGETGGESGGGQTITINITEGDFFISVGDTCQLHVDNQDIPTEEIKWLAIGEAVTVSETGLLTAVTVGEAKVYATFGDVDDRIIVTVVDQDIEVGGDPYVNVDKDEFYANYKPATSYEDAYYRSMHNLMSGTIEVPDAAPIISEYQPTRDGVLIRNTEMIFSLDGNTYYVYDAYGDLVMEIYKCGAYTALEEVAAYVYAFGTYPVNHAVSKKESPKTNPWGIYLRVNHTQFSGSTSKYPYEPELPNISGCGGTLQYWEMDIGTTGTGGGGYEPELYNDGISITRGAARIVYGKTDLNKNGIYEFGEHFVFYTYNHYNDFQEYLNYYGGWGEMFGNITGGGTLSSKYDYNPTPYVNVYWGKLTDGETAVPYVVVWYTNEFEKMMAAI